MRGKATARGYAKESAGITPAYAGKSVVFSFCLSLVQDHPRLCGEKQTQLPLARLELGSPPPMRGKDKAE